MVSFNSFGPHFSDEPLLNVYDFPVEPLILMPNPTHNSLYLNDEFVNMNYKVFTPAGLKKIEGNCTGAGIDVSGLQSGMYFINVNSAGVSQTKKFIKY